MEDEQTASSSEAVVEAPPAVESFTSAQRDEFFLTGKTPEAPKPADAAPAKDSQEKPDSKAGDKPAADGKTAPDSEPDDLEDGPGENASPQARKRFNQLLTQRAEWKVKAQMLERQLADSAKAKPGPEQPKPEPEAKAQPAPAEKAPRLDDVDDKGNPKWKSIEEWQDARDAFVRKQAEADFERKLAERDAQQAQQKAVGEFAQRADEVRKEIADYDEKLSATANEVMLTPAMQAAIFYEPEGPRLAYYFATHVDEAKEIGKLPAVAAAYRIGRIVAGFGKSQPADTKTAQTPPVKTHSTAPPPATDLQARNTAPADEVAAAVAAGDVERYMKLQNARETKR
jgi:hypothetical protein